MSSTVEKLLERLQAQHGHRTGLAMFAGQMQGMWEALEIAAEYYHDAKLGEMARDMLTRMESDASDGITVDPRYVEDFVRALGGEEGRDDDR